MNVWRFSIFTLVGATIWNTFLLYCGYKLRQNWTLVQQYSHEIDIVAGLLGVAALGIWAGVRYFRKRRTTAIKKA
jgi:membrane protein DedA with SNARE-associated domain